jgi:hypothetical protein
MNLLGGGGNTGGEGWQKRGEPGNGAGIVSGGEVLQVIDVDVKNGEGSRVLLG